METNITTNLPSYTPNTNLDANLRSLQSERTAIAAISTSKSLDVSLVTSEGDKVTISMEAKAAAMYGSFEETEMNEEGYSYQKGELTASLYEREMTFTVEGELSREEKHDIRKALKTLDRMMNNFVNGDLKPMLAKADKLQRLDSIATLEASMSYERTVLVAQQTQVTAVSETPAAISAPAAQAALPAQTPAPAIVEKADATADAMAKEIQSAQSPMERIMAFFDQLLEDYRKQMSGFDPKGVEMIDRVAGKLRDALAQFNSIGKGESKIAA